MTHTNTNLKTVMSGNGSTTTWSLTIRPKVAADFKVIHVDSSDDENELVLNTDYTVDMDTYQITFPKSGSTYSTLATGEKLIAKLNLGLTQETDISNQAFYPEVIEAELDRSRMIDQQQQEEIDRAVKIPEGSTETPENYLTTVQGYKNDAETAASAAQTSETNAASSATSASSSATSASTSASAASTSASAASTSASNASTSESNAATSATNASTSATNASTSETNAATSATNASTSETNASTSATNAATSATNAATSATNAENAWDSFDDVYLGAKASDPSVDNDGDALVDGQLYWNTSSNSLMAYNGSAWVSYNPNSAPVSSVHGRTGAVVSASGDYDDDEVSAAASATNYTPAASTVAGHLSGLDTALGALGGGGLVPLGSVDTTTASSITFSSEVTTDYHAYVIDVIRCRPGGNQVKVKLNNLTNGYSCNGRSLHSNTSLYPSTTITEANFGGWGTDSIHLCNTNIATASEDGAGFRIWVLCDTAGNNDPRVFFQGSFTSTSSAGYMNVWGGGGYNNNLTLSSITILPASGTIDCIANIYGVAKP